MPRQAFTPSPWATNLPPWKTDCSHPLQNALSHPVSNSKPDRFSMDFAQEAMMLKLLGGEAGGGLHVLNKLLVLGGITWRPQGCLGEQ